MAGARRRRERDFIRFVGELVKIAFRSTANCAHNSKTFELADRVRYTVNAVQTVSGNNDLCNIIIIYLIGFNNNSRGRPVARPANILVHTSIQFILYSPCPFYIAFRFRSSEDDNIPPTLVVFTPPEEESSSRFGI